MPLNGNAPIASYGAGFLGHYASLVEVGEIENGRYT